MRYTCTAWHAVTHAHAHTPSQPRPHIRPHLHTRTTHTHTHTSTNTCAYTHTHTSTHLPPHSSAAASLGSPTPPPPPPRAHSGISPPTTRGTQPDSMRPALYTHTHTHKHSTNLPPHSSSAASPYSPAPSLRRLSHTPASLRPTRGTQPSPMRLNSHTLPHLPALPQYVDVCPACGREKRKWGQRFLLTPA